MFFLGPVPALLPETVTARASGIASSTIGHMRDHGFAYGLRALTEANRVVGTAFTVRLPDLDSSMLHYAVDHLEPGHVLVVDAGGRTDRAAVGAMVAFAARHRGAAGIIIDGVATDLPDLVDFGLPVFARGVSPRTTRILGIEGAMNVPISLAGATVTPGMLVIADQDGVALVALSDFDALAGKAEAAQAIEPGVKEQISAGKRLSELSGAADLVLSKAVHLS